jgi:hypothetical protein
MLQNIKKIVIALAVVFMVLYFVNRIWRVPGERRSHGIIEEVLGMYN